MWFVVVDAFSKWPEVIQLHEGATSASQPLLNFVASSQGLVFQSKSCQIMGPNSRRQNSELSVRNRVFVIP